MGHKETDERALFDAIVQGQELRDAGIVSHDEALKELEVLLREKYIEKGFARIPSEDLDAYLEQANDLWPYKDEVATLSGRLDILSDDDDEIFERMFGLIALPTDDGTVIRIDPNDDEIRFILVDGAKLESGGVIADDMLDDDGKVWGVRIGYAFYHPDDKEGNTPLFAQPVMLDRHNYSTPTPAEARVRLEYKWPSQLSTIDSLLVSGESLPDRLTAIAGELCDDLKDQAFRELVELYVNEELELNMKTSYMTVVKNRIDSLEDIADEDAQWMSIDIEGALTLFVHAPEIRFSSVTEDTNAVPRAYLFGQTFNDEFGEKPEMVGIAFENIERFMSTRTATSLAARAIDAMDFMAEQNMRTMVDNVNEVRFAQIETKDEAPEYINRLEEMEASFERIGRISDEYLMHTFTERDAAQRDADELLKKVREHLNNTGFFSGVHQVEAMGVNIKTANLRYDLYWDEAQYLFLHGVDKEAPTKNLHVGDKISGTADKLYATVESTFIQSGEEPEDGGTIFYTPRVVMGVVVSQEVGITVDVEPALSQVISRSQAAVPLDSSSEIHFTILDQYRTNREAIERARISYGEESPLMQRIYALEAALNNESPDNFTPLEPTVLSRFSIDLKRVVRRHKKSTEPAEAVLEAMLSDRNILAVGQVYTREQNGQYTLDADRTGVMAGWRVIDVKLRADDNEVVMFVMSERDEQYRYITMSSLEEFKF